MVHNLMVDDDDGNGLLSRQGAARNEENETRMRYTVVQHKQAGDAPHGPSSVKTVCLIHIKERLRLASYCENLQSRKESQRDWGYLGRVTVLLLVPVSPVMHWIRMVPPSPPSCDHHRQGTLEATSKCRAVRKGTPSGWQSCNKGLFGEKSKR